MTAASIRLWLEDAAPSTPRRIPGKFASLALFDLYSQSAHVDGRNAMLVELAHECRDLALIMATSRRVKIDLAGLDKEINAVRDRWY